MFFPLFMPELLQKTDTAPENSDEKIISLITHEDEPSPN
jgi:hypothetical protein